MTDDALKAKLAFENQVSPKAKKPKLKEAPVAAERKFKLPDLTPAQIQADVIFVVGALASVGVYIDGDTSAAVTGFAVAALAVVNAAHKLADALIRGKRADNAEKLKA